MPKDGQTNCEICVHSLSGNFVISITHSFAIVFPVQRIPQQATLLLSNYPSLIASLTTELVHGCEESFPPRVLPCSGWLWLNKFLKPLDRTQKLSRLDAWRAIGPTGRGHMSSSLGGGAVAWEVAGI